VKLIKDTPSEINLQCLNNNESIKITVTKFDGNSQPYSNEFTNLNRSIFLFAEGHFAKGSLQFSPYTIFWGRIWVFSWRAALSHGSDL